MPQIINTNIPSLNAQRHLNASQNALSTALERLSSGKRINNAKDDAAGLAITSRMSTQINGMNQAIRNARDGISLGQTAEGALSTSVDMLQSIRTMAVQSSNATNASIDRHALQNVVNDLSAELNRIAMTTQFNGQNLLDGTMGAQNFQVGANAGDLITSNGMNFKTSVYGTHRVHGDAAFAKLADADKTFGAKATDFSAQTITINGPLGTDKVSTTAPVDGGNRGSSAQDLAAEINRVSGETGVTATSRTEAFITHAANMQYTFYLASENANAEKVTISYKIGNTNGGTSADDLAQAINAFNAQSAKTGVSAEYFVSTTGTAGIKLTNATGSDIMIANTGDDTNAQMGDATLHTFMANGVLNGTTVALDRQDVDDGPTTAQVKGVVIFDSNASFSLVSTGDADNAFAVSDGAPAATLSGGSILRSVASIDITTFSKAQLAIAIVDQAINTINKEMARYGALQARFDATIQNLEVNAENTTNAKARIMDADFAQETANLSRATILQQAGIAMLAQANQMPQNVLSLIR